MSGQTEVRYNISAISQADPCVVTTDGDHAFLTGNYVRITDLGLVGQDALPTSPVDRGMLQLEGGRFTVKKVSDTEVSLHDPITGEDIDSRSYDAYVEGGSINLITQTFEYESS